MTAKLFLTTSLTLALSNPVFAGETRELDAHVHGEGMLNIAIEGNQIAMELTAPGFDIVGFEHVAVTDADKASESAALAMLGTPDLLVTMPDAAGCAIGSADAELRSGEGHDEHDDHLDDGHDHEEHAEHDHNHDHDHNDAEAHANHSDYGHDVAHDDADGTTHSEFHARYTMTCADITQVTRIELPYFRQFPNAQKLRVQLITDKGATALDATRDDAELDLEGSM